MKTETITKKNETIKNETIKNETVPMRSTWVRQLLDSVTECTGIDTWTCYVPAYRRLIIDGCHCH